MSGFYKINIEDRENLTMLAMGFLNRLIPRATRGQIFYDYDKRNEIENIYFEKKYYEVLCEFISANKSNFFNSNATNEWLKLFSCLNKHIYLENVDFGILELYDMGTDPDNSPLMPNYNFFDNKNVFAKSDNCLYNDIKRVYPGIRITYWGNKNYIGISLSQTLENELTFDLLPVFNLLKIHDLQIEKFSIVKDKGTDITKIIFKVISTNQH